MVLVPPLSVLVALEEALWPNGCGTCSWPPECPKLSCHPLLSSHKVGTCALVLNVWCGWVAGAVLAELWTLKGRARFSRPSWWVVGAACTSVHVALVAQGSYTGPWQYLSLPITICLFVWPLALLLVAGESLMERDVSALARLMWKGLAGVGAFSYSLYLLHIPIQSIRFSSGLQFREFRSCRLSLWRLGLA